ncbi:MAG: baseplate J/gp47 family protein [Sandaracinobacter sp.]
MSDSLLDGRSEDELREELLHRATAVFGNRADAIEPGEVLHALLGVAARIGEEVTRRLDQVPSKQAANFYTAIGLGRAPPVPARMPVAFKLSNTAPVGLGAPAGTKLQATAGGVPVTFETESRVDLARGSLTQIYAADLADDRIFIAPGPVLAPALPRSAAVTRRLASGAGAGATALQIEPASGLAPGMVLRIGDPTAEADHIAAKVEGNLVTIAPPLGSTLAQEAPVSEVTMFAPWEPGARNHQSHTLYLGHATLLDLPSPSTIYVSGVISDQNIVWSWFGKLNGQEQPEWQAFKTSELDANGRWKLEKDEGKPEKTTIEGRNGLWLRAALDSDASSGVKFAQTIRIAIGTCNGTALTCPTTEPGVTFEVVAVTTPAVINKPFHPFGREPHIYDSFYVGCSEAFGKTGAAVRLCFTLGGASLGPMAAVSSGTTQQVFAVGDDGLLYRARFDEDTPTFTRLPLPTELAQTGFESQAPVAARLVDGEVKLSVAGRGCVYSTFFAANTVPGNGTLNWSKLVGDAASAQTMVSAIYLIGDHSHEQLALCGTTLFKWSSANGDVTLDVDSDVIDLIRVENHPETGALLVKKDDQGDWEISLWVQYVGGAVPIATVPADSLPKTMRAAWVDSANPSVIIAGYAAPVDDLGPERTLSIVAIDVGNGPVSETSLGDFPAMPIAFHAPLDSERWPVIVLATPVPTRIAFVDGSARVIVGDADIGGSANPARRFIEAGPLALVQHADQGLYYRTRVPDPAFAAFRLDGAYLPGVRAGLLPPGTGWLVVDGTTNGGAYEVQTHLVTRDALLRALSDKAMPSPGPGPFTTLPVLPLRIGTGSVRTATLVGNNNPISFDRGGYTAGAPHLYLLVQQGNNAYVWLLTPDSTGNAWTIPTGFAPQIGDIYTALEAIPNTVGNALPLSLSAADTRSYFAADSTKVTELSDAGATHPLFVALGSVDLAQAMTDGGIKIFPFNGSLLDKRSGDTAQIWLGARPGRWNALGPDQPANPDLSWEYWNGNSWWTLDTQNLRDTTADLLVDGGVFFTVPVDLAETDVVGRKNRWIRARLIGGDYGQARVTVETTGPPDNSKQTMTRDLSAIRAPYVMSLKLTYCAMTALPPETVLTVDNLGAIDQTNANLAELPVRFFPPVSTLFDPVLLDAPKRPEGEGVCCEQWEDSAPPAPQPQPQPPKDGTGRSCLSWDDPVASSATRAIARVLLLGFDQPPQGDAVSLYIDAAPSGISTEIKAFAFKAGGFVPIDVLGDTSCGLSETGVLLLGLPHPPDPATYFGQSCYWIALSPKDAAADWSPQLHGIYLNGTMAASVETRSNESLGASTGAPDQIFRLVAAPVDPDSLDLWITEPVGTEDAARLGAEDNIEGMPGPWVRWRQRPELPTVETLHPDRVFTLNALTGEISFGNGSNALVPPMGSALLARSYRKVIGVDANGVAAGALLQTVSPLAGVDKVLALDAARGGQNAETTDQALARAPSKLSNGDRLVTLADLEEYARHVPGVSQAAAANRRGGVQLVIAGRGTKLIPTPSELRGIAENIGGVATYGIAARIAVVPPRPVPLRVVMTFLPDRGADQASLRAKARAAITAFFDHETGGHDGAGWPLGAVPSAIDVAAAVASAGLPGILVSADLTRRGGIPLPHDLPAESLIRLAAEDVQVELVLESAA